MVKLQIRAFDRIFFTLENCPKPFKMVEEVYVSFLTKQFSNFAYWFPNLRRLFCDTQHFDFDASRVVFPQLEELWWMAFLKLYSEKRRFERFVRANQQLRCLKIIGGIQFSRLLEMISGHTSILKLGVENPNYKSKHVKRTLLMRFARRHRMLVRLDFFAFLLKADDAIALIRKLNSLEFFAFRLKDRAAYHYFVNQLQHEIGFMFQVRLIEAFTKTTVVHLKFNR